MAWRKSPLINLFGMVSASADMLYNYYITGDVEASWDALITAGKHFACFSMPYLGSYVDTGKLDTNRANLIGLALNIVLGVDMYAEVRKPSRSLSSNLFPLLAGVGAISNVAEMSGAISNVAEMYMVKRSKK